MPAPQQCWRKEMVKAATNVALIMPAAPPTYERL
jgi:hypothetical protein